MQKHFLSLLLLATGIFSLGAQTTATDFNTSDCAGNTHNLFAELNDGKVVIICWVMPCGTCIAPALAGSTALSDYASSHPDKVKFYVVDDYANTNCNTLSTWVSSNDITATALFSTTDVSMSNYGSAGMPKTVVLGGHGHQIFLNNNGALSLSTLKSAIDNALAVASVDVEELAPTLKLMPNPSSTGFATVSCELSENTDVTIQLLNLSGQVVKEITLSDRPAGMLEYELPLDGITPGLYAVSLTTKSVKTSGILTIQE